MHQFLFSMFMFVFGFVMMSAGWALVIKSLGLSATIMV